MIILILQIYLPLFGLALVILNTYRSASSPQKETWCIHKMLFPFL